MHCLEPIRLSETAGLLLIVWIIALACIEEFVARRGNKDDKNKV